MPSSGFSRPSLSAANPDRLAALRSFRIERSSVAAGDHEGLMREVAGHTASPDEASSIVRSLERLGSDASIHHYEMTPASTQRRYVGAASVVWTVRAVRPEHHER